MGERVKRKGNILLCNDCLVASGNGTICFATDVAKNRLAVWSQPGFPTRVLSVPKTVYDCRFNSTNPATLEKLRKESTDESTVSDVDIATPL